MKKNVLVAVFLAGLIITAGCGYLPGIKKAADVVQQVQQTIDSGSSGGSEVPGQPVDTGGAQSVNIADYRDKTGETLTFAIIGAVDGQVWGTDVYTDDSCLSTAAVHAGILKAGQKGTVRVTVLPGQSSYRGSTRNGVTSDPWESWDGSFKFEKK